MTPDDLWWPTACLKQLKPLNTKTESVRNDKYAWNMGTYTCMHMHGGKNICTSISTHTLTHSNTHTTHTRVTDLCFGQRACQRKKQHYNEKIRKLLWNSECCWRTRLFYGKESKPEDTMESHRIVGPYEICFIYCFNFFSFVLNFIFSILIYWILFFNLLC